MEVTTTQRSSGRWLGRSLTIAVAIGTLVGGSLGLQPAAAVPGVNLVTNPGFEAGTTGWSASGGTFALSDDAASGTKSGSLSGRTAFYQGLKGSLVEPLAHDGQYRVTAKVKHTAGAATEPFGFAYCPASGGCVAAASAIKQLAKGGWVEYSLDFVPNASPNYNSTHATTVFSKFQFETPWSSTVPFLLDDVSIVRLDQPSGVLPDGSFEGENFDGWYIPEGRAGQLALSTPGSESDQALRITGRDKTNTGPSTDVTGLLEKGATYRLAADLRYTGGAATQQFHFTLCDDNFTYGICFNAVTKTATQGQWTSFDGEFVANTPDAAVGGVDAWSHAFFETAWKATPTAADLVDFEIDNVSLVKIADAPTVVDERAVENVQTKPVDDHNPIVGHKFGADPHHLIYNDRLYIYSTSDDQQFRTAEKQANGLPVRDGGYERINSLNVWSTDDMVNWVDHGEVPVAGPNGAAPWATNSWAPAAVAADLDGDGDEEVYLYFCNGGSGTGVIVGGSPLGPWEDPNGKMLISQNNPIAFPTGMWLFDPEIFVDDDGQPYLYFGGNWDFAKDPYHPKSTRVVKLDPKDYTKLADPTGAGITVIDGPGMFEASSMFKKNGTYYYSYSSNFTVGNAAYEDKKLPGQAYPGTGQIAYMMSDDPMTLTRDEFAGTAFASHGKWFPGSGGNNHSDMFTYQGKDYFTYHTQVSGLAIGRALNGGKVVNYRSVHVDDLEFNADGTIKEVTGTLDGVDQIKNFDPFRTFEAETLAWQLGVRTDAVALPSVEFPEHNERGNTVLTKIDNGDWVGISQADFGDGAASVTAKVKPLVAGGSIEVRLDSQTGPLVGTMPVTSAVGQWGEATATLTGATGVKNLFFVFRGPDGQRLLEVDNWTFAKAGSTASPTPSPTPTPTATATPTPTATVTATVPGPTVTVTPVPTLPPGDLYSTPGFHNVGGRWWYTSCEPYSQTIRCRTDIWATTVTQVNGKFVVSNGWAFNSLTYLPYMTKQQWGDSHLANTGEYLIAGRKWRTECNTAATGANNCRSYVWASYIASEKLSTGGYRYYWTSGWLLNNIVRFKA